MSADANIYRNASSEVADHAKRLLAMHRPIDDATIGAVYRRRYARLGFGYAGTVAGLTALLCVALASEGQVLMLWLAWLAAFLGGAVAYFWAAHRFRQSRRHALSSSDDPHELVIRLTRGDDRVEEIERRLDHIEGLGLMSHRLPLLVGALLLPISLIALVFAVGGSRVEEIDQVLRFAFVYTVHVHLYAAIAAWRYPKKRHGSAMVGIATALGLLPFLVSGFVVGVVAVLVVCTYYLPITYWVDRENQWLTMEREERFAESLTQEAASPSPILVPRPVPALEVELR